MDALGHVISSQAELRNIEWPAFHLNDYEMHASDFRKLSRAEYVGVNNLVRYDEQEFFLNYTSAHFEEWVQEGHILAYGHLNRLNNDTSRFLPFIQRKVDGKFVPDIERDLYFARVTQSPPPRTYGPLANFNIASLGTNEILMKSAVALRNETLISPVKPYQALPPSEHRGFHTDDAADNPHSFIFHPVLRSIHDESSEVVAIINAAMAWDASMRNLLPENVFGIVCVIKNTCGQQYSYEVDGKEAFYKGAEDVHDPRFDAMEFPVDLSLHSHPEFENSPGHCLYSMVRCSTSLVSLFLLTIQ